MNLSKTRHIVVVGAETPLRHLLQDTLHRAGFCLYTVQGGQDLFHILATNPVDMVLLNMPIPGVDSFSLCATVRQTSNLPILLLLRQGCIEEIVHGFELGADDYLCQPFEPLDLLFRIEALLRRAAWQALSGMAPVLMRRRVSQPTTNPWGVMM